MKSTNIEQKPRHLSLDLGFRQNSAKKPGNKDHALLSQGLTLWAVEGNPIALARELIEKDWFAITIYDLSQLRSFDGPVKELSLELRFAAGVDGQRVKSPIAGGVDCGDEIVFSNFSIFPFKDASRSTVFNTCARSWTVRPGGHSFCHNQLQDVDRPPKAIFEVIENGIFYLSLSLSVKWQNGGPKIFRVDPEMVCSSSGGPPTDEPPKK